MTKQLKKRGFNVLECLGSDPCRIIFENPGLISQIEASISTGNPRKEAR